MRKSKSRLTALCCIVFSAMIFFTSCGNPGSGNPSVSNQPTAGHTHSFSAGWTSDGTYHWQACSGCAEVRNKAEHDWNAGIVTVAPTETAEGVKTFTCNTCGHSKAEAIPAAEHRHTFVSGWSSDENYHWHASSCGHDAEVADKAEHNWDNGITIKEATDAETGLKVYTCTVCKQTKTEVLSPSEHRHTYAETWSYNDNSHWHAATCGHDLMKSDEGAHDWTDTGRVITVATPTVEGEKEQECSVCGHIRVVRTGTSDHEHSFADEWSYDGEYHWHAATCGHREEVSVKSLHIWGDGEITKPATVDGEGVKTYTCSVCNAMKEETIPEPDSFAVVFIDNNLRTISERYYALGTTVGEILLPTADEREGYRFTGWKELTGAVNILQFDFSAAKNDDSFYFKATYEKVFRVRFKDYAGNLLKEIEKSESDGDVTEAECPAIPEREGYTSRWDERTLLGIDKDTVIVPVYEKITFRVVFKDNRDNVLSYDDGNGNLITKQIIDYGSFAVAPAAAPYYFDKAAFRMYEFSGWSASFDCVKEDLEIKAQYNKLYDKPVVAVKIDGNHLSPSVVLPSEDTVLYSLSLSFGWTVAKGACGIVGVSMKNSTPLNAGAHSGECTVGNKEDLISYNNKTSTFDFIWNCGHGHTFNNTHYTQDVFTLTFEVDGGAAVEESIFTLTENSLIVYGGQNDNVSDLRKTKPMIWFYK